MTLMTQSEEQEIVLVAVFIQFPLNLSLEMDFGLDCVSCMHLSLRSSICVYAVPLARVYLGEDI